jgi:serine protease inhibitor
MTTEGSYRYSERPDFQMLELPYLKSAFSMLVLLPTTKDGVRNLEASLSDGTLSEWIKELKQTEARVFLPRFELDTRYDLVDSLRSLGIEDAFSEARADFTRMSKEPGIYLSAVVTAARILVNEEGTEASAATGGVMTKAAKPLPAIVFRADHPFLFILRHNKTGEVLFLGRLENP